MISHALGQTKGNITEKAIPEGTVNSCLDKLGHSPCIPSNIAYVQNPISQSFGMVLDILHQ
jgi:hypothetical protein